MDWLFRNAYLALRTLARAPGFSITIVLTLAIAIAANSTVFSAVNAYLLRPLPFPDDGRLVMVYNSFPKMGLATGGSSIPDYLDRREGAPSLESLAIVSPAPKALTGDGPAEQLFSVKASPSLFAVLGVAPMLGRAFVDDEAVPGNERVVVLGNSLWRSRFGARDDVIGLDVLLDGVPYSVIGVMPPGFGFPDRNVDAWLPFAFSPEEMNDAERGNDFSITVGRLAPGATLEGLNGELDAIVRSLIERNAVQAGFIEATGYTGRASLLRETIVGDVDKTLYLLQGVVLAVLLIACANVASLQLARVLARRRELAVRAALGAGRARLAASVAVESLILTALGAGIGILVARGGLEVILELGLDRSSEGIDLVIDGRVALFTAVASLAGAFVAALTPLLSVLRNDLARGVVEAGRFSIGERSTHLFRASLVVMQVAVSFALLVAAGLLTKSFYQLQREGPGFDSGGVFTARITLPGGRYEESEPRRRFFDALFGELRSLPGVDAAGFTTALPFSSENLGATVVVDGAEPAPGASIPIAWLRSVNEDFFPSLGIPIEAGRNFSSTEAERVAIVDETFARAYWPDSNALGERVRMGSDPAEEWYTVIGVVPPVKHQSLTDVSTDGTIYWHYLQRPGASGFISLRTTLPPESLAGAASAALTSIDADIPFFDAMSLNARVARSLGPQRVPMVLTLVFAGIALTLAIVGIYGVLAWAVARRVGEIGIRMALGAHGRDIVGLVLWQGGRLTALGLIVGALIATAIGRVVSSQIEGVGAFDPFIIGASFVGLSAAAFLASWIPARRASRIDAMMALRLE